MFSAISRAFAETLRNLRNNFFQTFLSVLGVIIGVAALVAMLAMIDGLQAFAADKIADQSSLENLVIVPQTGNRIDGVYTQRDTIAEFTPELLAEFLDSLPYPARGELGTQGSTIGYSQDSQKVGLRYFAVTLPMLDPPADSLTLAGNFLTGQQSSNGERVAYVNAPLARRLLMYGDTAATKAIGRRVYLYGDSLTVTGVFKDEEVNQLKLFLPLSTLSSLKEADTPYPAMNLALDDVNNVLDAQEYANGWMERKFPHLKDATESFTQTGYLEQLAQGVLVFKIVMGFLIGIAVVVGGVGVMNVLLMSINERTPEIGVRKAVGANRRNIIVQFLSEAIAISVVGSFLGVLIGMGIALIAAPIMNFFVEDLEFRAVFTLGSLLTVAFVAVLIGVIFGTYPARKAAGLDPVEAIRR